jgi:hypothetical protein
VSPGITPAPASLVAQGSEALADADGPEKGSGGVKKSANVTMRKDRAEVNRISTAGGDPASVPRGESVNQTVLDRRRTHRHKLCIPLHLRIRGSVDLEQIAHSVNISERGVLLETDLPLRVGLLVDMRLVFRGELTAERTTELHCLGRVVRVVSQSWETQTLKAGVRFDQLRVPRVEGS